MSLTEAEARRALEQLRERATELTIGSYQLDRVVFVDEGDKGLFVPPLRNPRSWIELRAGRDALPTLCTLCHELGHFLSFACGLRSDAYTRATNKLTGWRGTILTAARNTQEVMDCGANVPHEVWVRAVSAAKSNRPNRLSDSERNEILGEEARAWSLGFHIASTLGVARALFTQEANDALADYCAELGVPPSRWDHETCSCELTPDSQKGVDALIKR